MDSTLTPAPVSGGAFDCGALAPPLYAQLREDADFIKARHARMVEDAVAIGERLLKVKEALGHGRFLAWLLAECSWTDRTAQNYMAAARKFAGKTETVSYLPAATVYQLAHATEEVRAKVLSVIEAERPPAEEVKGLLQDAKKVAAAESRTQRRAARKSPEAREAERRKQERRDRKQAKIQEDFEAERRRKLAARSRVALALRECWPGQAEDLAAMLREAGERTLADWVLHAYGQEAVAGVLVPRQSLPKV